MLNNEFASFFETARQYLCGLGYEFHEEESRSDYLVVTSRTSEEWKLEVVLVLPTLWIAGVHCFRYSPKEQLAA